MTDVATLSDGEIIALRDVLAAARNPQQLAEIEARAREIEERETRAAYEREIAESQARAARDPIAQELFRKAREQAAADRVIAIRAAHALAKQDTREEVDEARRRGMSSLLTPCSRCHQPALKVWLLGARSIPMCPPCHAAGQLKCENCGNGRDEVYPCNWIPSEQRFRCQKCTDQLEAEGIAEPRFLIPGMGAR